MRRVALSVVAVLAVAAAIYPYNQSGNVSLVQCYQNFQLCTQACDVDFQNALAALAPDFAAIERQRQQEVSLCGPPINDEARRCIADANARAAAAVARLKAPANAAHAQCVLGCRGRRNSCYELPHQLKGAVEMDCIGWRGSRCFTGLPKVCTQMDGACGDCGISFCGGGEWKFDSEVPLTVTLLASVSDLSNPRVVAASTPVGNQAVLNVPTDITLDGKEQLYLQFSSTAKPKGKVRVQVHRDK
jgi:hypothetical protein